MAANSHSDSDSLTTRLKASRPSSLNVVLLDGTNKNVAIPGKRKKWSAVRRILDTLAWIRLECLDAKGGVVDIVENDEAADELEDLDGYGGQVHQLVALMLKAQDVALRRQEKMMSQTMDMNLKLSQVVMDRLNALERSYGQNLKLVQKFAQAAGEEGEGDGLMSTALIEALAPHLIMRLAPGLVAGKPKVDPTQ